MLCHHLFGNSLYPKHNLLLTDPYTNMGPSPYSNIGGPRSWYARFWLFADWKTANDEGHCYFWPKLAKIRIINSFGVHGFRFIRHVTPARMEMEPGIVKNYSFKHFWNHSGFRGPQVKNPWLLSSSTSVCIMKVRKSRLCLSKLWI